VQEDAMKESVKITVVAAGFREVAGKKTQPRPSYLPETWKTARAPQPAAMDAPRSIYEIIHKVPTDDLDVPTFLRRQAQKA
jgi:hypothetical protein